MKNNGKYLSSLLGLVFCLATAVTWAQVKPAATDVPEAGEAIAEDAPETEASTERVELNLLGQTDSAAGESRRNENIQFNLVDNNALKELSVRLGTTATIIEEFEPERNYFSSEFGNAPSPSPHILPATASDWHGSAFYSHLNSVFSARSFFQVGAVAPALENDYGFDLALPVWKGGHLLLDASQDKLRGSVNGNVLVPKPEERTPLATDPETRAIVERFLAAYPEILPNRTDINPRALNTNAPQVIDNNIAGIRLDQEIGSKDRLMLQYRFIAQSVEAFQFVAGQNPNTDTKSHRARLTWARQWSPFTTTDFSVGFDRIGSLLLPAEGAVGPLVSISGLTGLGPSGSIPIDRAQNVFRYAGQLRRLLERHTVTAGFNVARRQFNGIESDTHRGFFSFGNDFGRTGIENFRLGIPSQHVVSIGDVNRGFRDWLPAFYVGDNWKAGPRLTLQLGLRYAPVPRPVEVNDRNDVAYDCDCNNFAPQFGFAYRLPGTWGALRAAYGLHYGEIFPVTYGQIRFSPPGSVKFAVPAPDLVDPLAGIGEGTDALPNLYLLDPKLASPYSHQYNFSWEPEISGDWALQLGYVGSRSHKLPVMWYLNRAHAVDGIEQTTATINQRRANTSQAETRWVLNGSRGYFDAARASLVAPRFHGFSIDASYWFSKAMDLGAAYTNTAADLDSRLSRSQSEFETHQDRRALSSFDQTHAFLLRTTYEFPHGRWQGWADRVAGGWMVSVVALVKTGTPFMVSTSDGPGFGNVDGNGGDRPNLEDPSILGRTIGNPDTSRAMLPASAFSFIQPTEEAGNLGANVFRKAGIGNLNASVSRTWKLAAQVSLLFRAETINLTNTPQFAEPGAVAGTPEFGQITNTLNDGRTFRFFARLGW